MLSALLLSSLALAGPPVALSTPSPGGALHGVNERGIMGMAINPASAFSKRYAIKLDAGLIAYNYAISLDGTDQIRLEERYGEIPEGWAPIKGSLASSGVFPIGSIGLQIPLGPVGLGLETGVPIGITGSNNEDSPARYHTLGGLVLEAEQNVALAAPVHFANTILTFGAAYRVGYVALSTQSASDTGAIIYALSGGEEGAILDPLFEGRRSYGGDGIAHGFAVGLHWETPTVILHAAYRSQMSTEIKGDVEASFSTSFNLDYAGDFSTQLTFPPEFHLGLTIPINEFEIRLNGGWVGWSYYRQFIGEITNASVTSESSEFQFLIDAYGVDYMDLLTADMSFVRDNGHQDSFFGELTIGYAVNPKLKIYTVLGHSTQAIPEAYHTPANFDFPTTQVRGILSLEAAQNWSFHFNVDYLHRPEIVVPSSAYSLTSEPTSGLATLPGSGVYNMSLSRIGLTTVFQY